MKTLVIDKKTPLNGKQKETVKPTITALTVIEKAEEVKQETKTEAKEVPKVLSFEERKTRSKELSILFDKHEKLKNHAGELLKIVKSDESVNTRFYLESSNGDEWQTTNQEFIKKTVQVMQKAILEKIEEVETEIELIQIG